MNYLRICDTGSFFWNSCCSSFAFGDLASAYPLLARFGQYRTRAGTTERELSGCRRRDDEFPDVIVYSSSDEWPRFENADGASDVLMRVRRASVD